MSHSPTPPCPYSTALPTKGCVVLSTDSLGCQMRIAYVQKAVQTPRSSDQFGGCTARPYSPFRTFIRHSTGLCCTSAARSLPLTRLPTLLLLSLMSTRMSRFISFPSYTHSIHPTLLLNSLYISKHKSTSTLQRLSPNSEDTG